MLVKLYDLPSSGVYVSALAAEGIEIRRVMAYEKIDVLDWVLRTFSSIWASECDICFSRQPISVFGAFMDSQIRGFACYEATCRDYFGPIGVGSALQNRGIGKALLLSCLKGMWEMGYGYAIIGGVGGDVRDFYARVAGATPIKGSSPGLYKWLVDRSKA